MVVDATPYRGFVILVEEDPDPVFDPVCQFYHQHRRGFYGTYLASRGVWEREIATAVQAGKVIVALGLHEHGSQHVFPSRFDAPRGFDEGIVGFVVGDDRATIEDDIKKLDLYLNGGVQLVKVPPFGVVERNIYGEPDLTVAQKLIDQHIAGVDLPLFLKDKNYAWD